MTKKQTIIVNYESNADRDKFMAENADMLEDYKVIWANDRSVNGVRVDFAPDTYASGVFY